MDADALVKLTKAGAKELIVEAFEIVIPEAVEAEIVGEGRDAEYADASLIAENVRLGRIAVEPALREDLSFPGCIVGGDRAVLNHSLRGGYAVVVTDDAALLRRLKGLGVSATLPAALLLAAGRRRRLSGRRVGELLEALRPHISSEEYVTCLLKLEGRYPRR